MIAYLGEDDRQAVVRDVQNPAHAVTACVLPSGAPRFVSATKVALWNAGDITILDLLTGERAPVLTYVHNDGPVTTVDWSSDGRLFAYGRLEGPGFESIAFHLVSHGIDRVLATVASATLGVGVVRVEFSPGDDYVAFGAPGSLSTGDHASVQVRRLDGTLVFSSGGTGQVTWAGETPKLYFESPAGVEIWDPSGGVTSLTLKTWEYPMRSPGGRWLAYVARSFPYYPYELRAIDTRNGSDRSLGQDGEPAWVTGSLIRFNRVLSCPSDRGNDGFIPCTTKASIYDMTDGSLSDSLLGHVFGTWPKSSSNSW